MEGGFDGKIRFPKLEEEFCQGKLDQKIYKVDIGPLMLAIKAKNTACVTSILKADLLTNLNESLKGPKDIYLKDDLKGEVFWNYTYTVTGESNKTLKLPFYNLGYAVLCDFDQNDNKANQ